MCESGNTILIIEESGHMKSLNQNWKCVPQIQKQKRIQNLIYTEKREDAAFDDPHTAKLIPFLLAFSYPKSCHGTSSFSIPDSSEFLWHSGDKNQIICGALR